MTASPWALLPHDTEERNIQQVQAGGQDGVQSGAPAGATEGLHKPWTSLPAVNNMHVKELIRIRSGVPPGQGSTSVSLAAMRR